MGEGLGRRGFDHYCCVVRSCKVERIEEGKRKGFREKKTKFGGRRRRRNVRRSWRRKIEEAHGVCVFVVLIEMDGCDEGVGLVLRNGVGFLVNFVG